MARLLLGFEIRNTLLDSKIGIKAIDKRKGKLYVHLETKTYRANDAKWLMGYDAGRSIFDLQSWLSYLLILVAISPYERFIPNWIYGLLAGSWLLITAVIDMEGLYLAFIGAKGKNALIYLWLFYRIIAAILGHAQFPIQIVMITFCFQMFWYYANNKKILKRQLIIALSYFSLIVLNSILQLRINPMISRNLAGASFEDAGLLMAGFFTVYSIVFLCTALFVLMYTSTRLTQMSRRCIVLGLSAGSLMLLLAQYMIALLIYATMMVVFFMLLSPISARINMIVGVIISFVILFYIILPFQDIAFVNRSDLKLTFILGRIGQVWNYIFDANAKFNTLGVRPTLYSNSFSTFLAHPLWGVGSYVQDRNIVGEHSELFDTLARFGLTGFICFALAFGSNAIKIIKMLDKSTRVFLLYLGYLALLFLNPGLRITDGVALFYLLPALFLVWGKDRPAERRRSTLVRERSW